MKRSKKPRNARRRILILCEGHTEKNYFQGIKEDPEYKNQLLAVNPEVVVAKSPSPELVVKEAIKRRLKAKAESNAYDEIWVVFDHDHHAHRQGAYDLADENGIRVAFSAIAFEIWYLLHFIQTGRAYEHADLLLSDLKKHYRDYKKAGQNDFANLKDKLIVAISNANWLRNQVDAAEKHTTDCNPWTDVDILVKGLIDGLRK